MSLNMWNSKEEEEEEPRLGGHHADVTHSGRSSALADRLAPHDGVQAEEGASSCASAWDPLAPSRRRARRRFRARRAPLRWLARTGVALALVPAVLYLSSSLWSGPSSPGDVGAASAAFSSRHLLADEDDDATVATDDSSNPSSSPAADKSAEAEAAEGGDDNLFPPDLFTEDQLKNGAITLYIIGIIYMFYALALVCDEFFVPSLDVITEKLQISPDVAGATFMAAGGSAPELFTSIIGVFIAKSDVGIGTIVGSAVFNILFVIAACAFAAKEALSLTAWPLIRDVFFYSVSLIVLVAFFLDNQIEWYEALLLFLWYGAYVSFMKFNESVEDGLRKCFHLPTVDRESKVRGVTLRQAQHRKGLYHLMNETINPGILKKSSRKSHPVPSSPEGEEMRPLNRPPGIMIGDPTAPGGMAQPGHVPGAPGGSAGSGGGGGGISELKQHLQETEAAVNGDRKQAESELMEVESLGQIPGQQQQQQQQPPYQPQPLAASGLLSQQVTNGAGGDASAAPPAVLVVDGSATAAAADTAAAAAAASASADADEGDEDPIDMSFPRGQGWKKITIYLISLPIMGLLYITLPDTKDPKKRKWFMVTFFGSIIWIAIYSYLMVWWATTTGKTFDIPDAIMGLTFLAAGTSVPDLITSVLVAKQGKGDMAVSSSVGSNIFDVTVGLPFPWLLYTAVFQQPVEVQSQGAGCSIIMLFLMLLAVFLCIVLFKWRMTKGMGIMMMILYVVFVVVSLGFIKGWYSCEDIL